MAVSSSGYYSAISDSSSPAPFHTHSHNFSPRDWNAEFQAIVDAIAECPDSESLQWYEKLTYLALEFKYVAKVYGKIIILEKELPREAQTIKPISVGGTQQQYVCESNIQKALLVVRSI